MGLERVAGGFLRGFFIWVYNWGSEEHIIPFPV